MEYKQQIETACDLAFDLSQKNTASLERQLGKTGLVPDTKRAASSACKHIVLYIEMFCKGFTILNFSDFTSQCIDNGFIKPFDFWMNKVPQDVLNFFSPGKTVKRISDYEQFLKLMKTEDVMGMLRIITGKDKNGNDTKHSIICFSKKAEPYIADTSYRGVDVPARTFLKESNFAYFEYMV